MKKYRTTDGNQFQTYFKYISDNQEVIDGIFLKHKIRFTQPAALNDPLESLPQIDFGPKSHNLNQRFIYKEIVIPSYMDFLRAQVVERFYNEYGILSLTKQPLNYTMWNYYSNCHKGVVLELKEDFLKSPCFLSSSRQPLEIINVKYVQDYKVDFKEYVNGLNNFSFDDFIQKIIAIKTNHWEYEKEYRVVRSLAESEDYQPRTQRTSFRDRSSLYLFDFSLECINSVVFGVNTEQSLKKKIMDACRSHEIGFIQAVIVQDNGVNMSFEDISKFGSEDVFLNHLPQVFITDAQSLSLLTKKNINSLNEIPFYSLFRNSIDEFLENRRRRLSK
jgi:hypothetical protein